MIPCYNEVAGIEQVVMDLDTVAGHRLEQIIVVNDGSDDGTVDVLRRLEQSIDRVEVIHSSSNRGYGAALKLGIRHARTEFVLITDADGTYSASDALRLLDEPQDDDMLVGSRTGANVTYPIIRRIPKLFLTAYASWMAGTKIPDLNSGLRLFRRSVFEELRPVLPNGFSFTTTITLGHFMKDYTVRYLPIDYRSRVGSSKIRPIRDTTNFFLLILRTATFFAPIRVFAPIALISALFFLGSLAVDLLIYSNVADTTVASLFFTLNVGMFALIADLIHRSR